MQVICRALLVQKIYCINLVIDIINAPCSQDPVTRIALRIQCCYICWCWRGAPFIWPALYLLLFATTVAPWQLTNFSSVGDPTLDCMSAAPGLGLQSFREVSVAKGDLFRLVGGDPPLWGPHH